MAVVTPYSGSMDAIKEFNRKGAGQPESQEEKTFINDVVLDVIDSAISINSRSGNYSTTVVEGDGVAPVPRYINVMASSTMNYADDDAISEGTLKNFQSASTISVTTGSPSSSAYSTPSVSPTSGSFKTVLINKVERGNSLKGPVFASSPNSNNSSQFSEDYFADQYVKTKDKKGDASSNKAGSRRGIHSLVSSSTLFDSLEPDSEINANNESNVSTFNDAFGNWTKFSDPGFFFKAAEKDFNLRYPAGENGKEFRPRKHSLENVDLPMDSQTRLAVLDAAYPCTNKRPCLLDQVLIQDRVAYNMEHAKLYAGIIGDIALNTGEVLNQLDKAGF